MIERNPGMDFSLNAFLTMSIFILVHAFPHDPERPAESVAHLDVTFVVGFFFSFTLSLQFSQEIKRHQRILRNS